MSEGPAEIECFAFDEFKLYYESTEKVVDRRLALNSWNYGLCIALLGGIGAFTAWGLSKPSFYLMLIIANPLLAGMGAILCSLWIGQIRDFKMLNNAKFEVLNNMASKIRFASDSKARSAEPFAKEWAALQRLQATRESHSVNIVTLKASNAEFLVPRAFSTIYIGIIVAVVVFAAMNVDTIQRSAFHVTLSTPTANVEGAK
jgi:hypothetical protein